MMKNLWLDKPCLGVIAAAVLLLGVGRAAATPDISGPWQIEANSLGLRSMDGVAPPLLPAAQAQYLARMADLSHTPRLDPVKRCLPPGVPRLMLQAYPFNVVQGIRTIGFVFEWNHLTRMVFMDRDHFETIGPLYLGQAVGHWEGDTLVVDTNSFGDTTWLDDTGLPHSDRLHTIEHIRLIDGGARLEDRITIDDPIDYAKSWDAEITFKKRSGAVIHEDYCLGRTGQ